MRIVLGVIAIIAGLAWIESSGWRVVTVGLGVVLLVTGLIRFCPISKLVGRNTCRQRTDGP